MKFINRDSEFEELENISKLSEKKLFTTLIYGPRRVGKTELVKQFTKNKRNLYFFVYENKTKESLLAEFETELKDKGYLEKEVNITDMDAFIRFLFRNCEGVTIIFDEIQFMHAIYPAFFSVLQREIDDNQGKKMHIIFLGSIVGLIKNVFEDMKAPLYGRIKSSLRLSPLSYKNSRQFMEELKYGGEEEFIRFYSVFGGYPKYYVAAEDYALFGKKFVDVMIFLFFRDNAPLRNEVVSVLRQEFGAGKSYYYTILEAIATGHTKLSEIASYMGRTPTGITSFMDDLVSYYEIIERIAPVTEKKPKKNTIYRIRNPLFRFWFRHVYPIQGYFESGQYEYIIQKFIENSNSFIGVGFEAVCREYLLDLNRGKKLPFVFHKIGVQWGRKDSKETYEIDIAALNGDTKEILFAECKWKDKIDAGMILKELEDKARFVEWNKGKRKEYFAVFAKSFSSRVKEFNGKPVFCFDLNDLEKAMRSKSA